MIYISIRFKKKINKTRGLFHVWLGLYANLLVAFFSFVFVSFGMRAYLGFGDSGFWGFGWFIFVSDHFLQQISIFQTSFWFVKTLFYRFGFRNSG